MKKKIKILAFFAMALFVLQGLYGAKCLIITGQNNHEWVQTTPEITHILNLTGKIDVEVKDNLDLLSEADFKGVDFIVMNWNNWHHRDLPRKDMPEKASIAIENFVKNGGGVISIHAAAALNNVSDGIRQLTVGKFVGGKTKHPSTRTFLVNVIKDHPVTKGLSSFMIYDELWVDPEYTENAEILAESLLSVESATQIKRNPPVTENIPSVAFAKYGKGKCVYTTLGHDYLAMRFFGFRTLLINSAFWMSDIKSNGLYMNNIDLDKAFAEIEKVAAFGQLNLMHDMEMLFMQLDTKSREKLLVKIEELATNEEYSVSVHAWARRIVDSYNTKPEATKVVKVKADKQDLKDLLAKGDALSEDEKMLALGEFARNKFLPALEFAKANAIAENKNLAMHAISALPALASSKDYPFFEELYKKYSSDPGMMRYVTEAFLSVDADKFDVFSKINTCDEESMPMYAMLGHALKRNGLDLLLVEKIKTVKSENCAKELLTTFLLASDNDTVKNLVSLYGISNARDTALTRALASFAGNKLESYEGTLEVFKNSNVAIQAKMLPALSVSNSKEIFNEVMKSLEGENKAIAKNTLKKWRDESVLTELAKAPESLRGDANEIAASIISNMKELTDPQVALLEKMLSYNAENTDVLKKAFDIINVPVTRGVAARGNANLTKGATAESVFKHGKDGHAGEASAVIDGDPATYWDESDHKGKYGIRIILPEEKEIIQIRIFPYSPISHTPIAFDVVLDGKNVMRVQRAVYDMHGRFFFDIPKTKAKTVELIIDGMTGPSAAIREIEIY